jgi:hypothetical protein
MVMTKKVPKINVEQTKGNARSYLYLYSIGDLVQRSFHKGLYVRTDQRSFLTNSELKVN